MMKEQTLGKMIASLRRERGMTQAELAGRMGVTDKAVSKWERDLSCPDIHTLPKLAGLFEVSVDDLMGAVAGERPGRGVGAVRNAAVLACKGVALALGVAVTVLSALKAIDLYSGFSLLGIGLTCAGLVLLQGGGQQDRP